MNCAPEYLEVAEGTKRLSPHCSVRNKAFPSAVCSNGMRGKMWQAVEANGIDARQRVTGQRGDAGEAKGKTCRT